ncbi:MAG TPA: glycerol kinase GlpK [Acidobacteriaceae bacterium]|nr:glycerol kinase GlpK [Acidobacteriaceae bacterium]
MTFILGLDQGTSSSRAVLMRADGTLSHIAQRELPQIYPQPGWVEQDPEAIWSSQAAAVRTVLAESDLGPAAIHSIGITNQRETTLVWERATGRPIANAIVWQDRRTANDCAQLAASEHNGRNIESLVSEKTGLVLDAYFSASKIRWILHHVPGARAQAQAGLLAFGTVDTWLVWKLTGSRRHITDVSNASRTLLFNIHTLAWDDELLDIFDIPRSMLPDVIDSSGDLAVATELLPHTKITGIAGDQQAALFGQMCLHPGMAKNTYGTGCFFMLQTGTTPVRSSHRLLTTVAWRIAGQTNYALEGSIFVAGAAIQWLRDGLGILNSAPEVEALAASVPDSGGVIFVPALTGLGAPHWDPHARGAIFGLTRGATRAHLARAALEGITLQVADIVRAMESDADDSTTGLRVHELRVDGGASTNDLLMQMQADVLGIPIVRSQTSEATVVGACYLAGLGSGVWSGAEELERQWCESRRFEPQSHPEERSRKLAAWHHAIQRARG